MHCSGSKNYWIAFIAMFCAATVFAQVDATSPKSAVKNLYAAVQRADPAAIQQSLLIPNDPQNKLASAYADLILAGKRLGDIASHKFPNVPDSFAQGAILPEDAEHIDSAEVTIAGNRAQMKFTDRATPINLQQSPTGWRIVVEDSDPSPKHRADQITLLQGLAEALKKSADEIDADKYPTVEDAENAVKQRLGAVAAKSMVSDSTSKPATQP